MGTQREYETVIIMRPETNKAGVLEFVEKVQAILRSKGSRLQEFDNWGVRTLAYPIAHQPKGVYLYLRFLGGSDVVQELERNFRITEKVLRFLSVRVDEDIDPAARPGEVSDKDIDEVAEPGEDPVEVERRRREEEARVAAETAAAERAAREAAAAEAAAAAAAAAEGESSDEGEPEADESATEATEATEEEEG
jgi:small subunit ribosomal protein S6